jgi:phage-related protein
MPEFIMKKAILRKTNDTISLATALLNGKNMLTIDYNNALAYYNESGILFKTKL